MKRRQRGVTLIDILFAIFITAMMAAVLAAAMPVAQRGQRKAEYQNKATNAAEKLFAALRKVGFANINNPTLLANNRLIDSPTPVIGTTDHWWITNSFFTTIEHDNFDTIANILPGGWGQVQIVAENVDLLRVVVKIGWREPATGVNRERWFATKFANI